VVCPETFRCTLCIKDNGHSITGHQGPRGGALLILNLGVRRGVGGQHHTASRFTPGKDPVPIVQEAGWAPGPVWTCAKNLAPTGIPSPDRPARSQSLYRLSYPAHSCAYTSKLWYHNGHKNIYVVLRVRTSDEIALYNTAHTLQHTFILAYEWT
jgi:hypothetical protein